jgi:LysR family hydrogen peroxide-inducible transcriptional activator
MSYPKGPSVRQIAALAAAIDCGSIRQAAQRMGMTQPALSAQIAALEEQLGLALLDRTRKGVMATPEGRSVDLIGRRVLDGLREIVDRGRGAMGDAGHEMSLDLGVSVSVGPYLLPRALPLIRQRAPGLKINVREGSTDRLAAELSAGAHDLALTQLPVPGKGIGWSEIGTERLMILMASGNPLAQQARITPADLKGHSFVTLGPGFVLTRMTERLASECGAEVRPGYEGNSMDALRLLCALDDSIALVPALYAKSEVRAAEGVAVKPMAQRRLERMLVVAWRKAKDEPPLARLIAGCLGETLKTALAGKEA